jgi:hypothetical protein
MLRNIPSSELKNMVLAGDGMGPKGGFTSSITYIGVVFDNNLFLRNCGAFSENWSITE